MVWLDLPHSLNVEGIVLKLVFSVTAIAWLRWLANRIRLVQAGEKLPGPPLPGSWLGHAGCFLETVGTIPGNPSIPNSLPLFLRFMAADAAEGLFRMWRFHPYILPFARLSVVVVDPDLVRQVLIDKQVTECFVKAEKIYNVSRPLVGSSFISLPDNAEWKHQRKIVGRGFRHTFLEHTNQVVARLLNDNVFPTWDKAIVTRNVATVEMVELCTRLTAEVLGVVGFSCSLGGLDKYSSSHGDSLQHGDAPLYEMYQSMLSTIVRRILSPPWSNWFQVRENVQFQKNCNILDSVMKKIIQDRLKEVSIDNAGESRNHKDLLSFMLHENDEGYRLPYKYLFGNVRMLLFVGHDTTAAALSSALWELATNYTVQARLQEEVDEFFDRSATEGKAIPEYRDLMQLKYLDAVVKETLRLHGPGLVGRTVTKDFTLRQNDGRTYTIPASTVLYVIPVLAHRNAKYFPDQPDNFVPERFLEDVVGAAAYAANTKNLQAFSVGPRNCVGQPLAITELKVVLSQIVRRYRLKRNSKAIEPITMVTLTMKPHAVLLDLERRQGVECT
jgi:cytochrome P450